MKIDDEASIGWAELREIQLRKLEQTLVGDGLFKHFWLKIPVNEGV